jgi:hypothetical protein
MGLILPTRIAAQGRAMFSADEATGRVASRRVSADPIVIRSRQTTADLTLLAAAGDSASGFGTARVAARSVDLNLFADVDLVAQLDHVEVVAPLGYAWVGQVAGVSGSEVVLAVADGVLTGSMKMPGRTYSVRQAGDTYVITEINSQAVPGDDVALPPQPLGAGVGALGRAAGAPVTSSLESGDVFDLLLYYTPAVKNAAGGTGPLNSFITGSIAQVNAAYASSDIATRVRLVAALEIAYADSGNTAIDLPALQSNSDVRAARDQYGADIVSMLVASDPVSSGRGYITVSRGRSYADAAYNVVVYYPNVGYIYSLAHELGHNLGCLHELGNNGGDDTAGAFPYSLGYTDTAHGFHDVMSYGLGCPDCVGLNLFSNPISTYRGLPLGTGAQDGARTINTTRAIVANYRAPAGAAGTPAAPTGLTATSSGSTVSLTWNTPSSGAPTAYVIEAGSASGLADLATFSTNSTATSFSSGGAANGTYYLRVRATNPAGTSSASNEVIVVVGGDGGGRGCTAAPAAPSAFVVTGNSGGTVSFRWNASANATSYVIETGSTPGAANLANSDLGSTATAFTAAGVGRGTYYVRLRAKNTCGTSGASNELTLIVP